MKTEALRAMANDLKYNVGVIHSNPQLILEESFISGVRYGQSNPKIKQLEWVEWMGTSSHYFAESPVGNYTILRVHNFDGKELWRLYFNGRIMVNDINPNEAKSAAQADFEKRVMECLDL